MLPKTLPDDALDAVPPNGFSVDLPGDRHAQARPPAIVPARQHLETPVGGNHRLCKDVLEIRRRLETILARVPRTRARCLLQGAGRVVSHNAGPRDTVPPCATARTRSRESAHQAERRFLPLARRALITARPARVAMRARKPCLRARFRRLGWNVRFIDPFLCNRGLAGCGPCRDCAVCCLAAATCCFEPAQVPDKRA